MKRVELSVENLNFSQKTMAFLQFQNFAFESESESSLRFTAQVYGHMFTGRYRLENCVPPV